MAATSQLFADIITWYYQFVHLNQTNFKRLPSIISDMKIFFKLANFPFSTICIESKMIKQLYRNAYILFNILEYCIHINVEQSANIYMTWKGY